MIRVLRVLEYEYDNAERFAIDQANWTMRLGKRNGVRDLRMVSSIVSITTTKGEIIEQSAEAPEHISIWPDVDARTTR